MKKLVATCIVFILLIGCSKNTNADENKNSQILKYVTDLSELEKVPKKPITLFSGMAETSADKKISITKNNIKDALADAANYTHCIITVENHTIVKITDLNDCKQSGSWTACMPKAKGYIKKGSLKPQKDYINNIIGLPDDQKRMMYLFK